MVVTTKGPTCSWAVYTTVPWIQVNSAAATGSGSGLIPFKVAANPGSTARAGNLLVADKIVSINQSAGPVGSAATSYTTVTYAAGLSNPTGLAFSTAKGLIIAESTGARIARSTSEAQSTPSQAEAVVRATASRRLRHVSTRQR